MANHDHESDSNQEWDDCWEAANWNEFNWEQYLRAEEDEVSKYQTLYNKLVRSANRLDEVALFMGWQQNPAIDAEDSEAQDSGRNPLQPYTIHRHPLFVASKALHGWLAEKLGQHIALCAEQISTTKALGLQSAFGESDYYGMLAVTALDMDDYALAIAYFKRGMVALNKSLSLLAELESSEVEPLPHFAKQARIRLFDIREIWLRVTNDCRATIARGSDED